MIICIGTIVNVITILVGGVLGLLLKKILSKRLTDAITVGLGLAVIIIGIGGALSAYFVVNENGISTENTLLMIIALAIGALTGELLQIDDRLNRLAEKAEKKFSKVDESTFAQGFVTATLLFCVGSMAIVGALEDGINRNPEILFVKSALDGISAMVFASALGVGVLFSAVIVVVYQGSLTLLAVVAAPYLNDETVRQMSLIGSILILAIGLNMLKIAKIKTANLLPAIFIPVIYFVVLKLFD